MLSSDSQRHMLCRYYLLPDHEKKIQGTSNISNLCILQFLSLDEQKRHFRSRHLAVTLKGLLLSNDSSFLPGESWLLRWVDTGSLMHRMCSRVLK